MARVTLEDEPESTTATYTSATDIPLRHPSERRRPHSSEPLLAPPEIVEIDKEVEEEDPDGDFREEVFDTVMMTVPFTFLFILLHVLVHLQYGHRPSIDSVLNGLLTAIPTLGITLFYCKLLEIYSAGANEIASRHAENPMTRGALMTASLLSGSRLIWLVNKASWSVVTAQAPAMGTIWILTIVQLPLSRALLCLLGVGGWVWWTGMKIYP